MQLNNCTADVTRTFLIDVTIRANLLGSSFRSEELWELNNVFQLFFFFPKAYKNDQTKLYFKTCFKTFICIQVANISIFEVLGYFKGLFDNITIL